MSKNVRILVDGLVAMGVERVLGLVGGTKIGCEPFLTGLRVWIIPVYFYTPIFTHEGNMNSKE